MDYFISSSFYHQFNATTAQEYFSEQLIQIESLGFYFNRPSLDDILTTTNHQSNLSLSLSQLIHRTTTFYELIKEYLSNHKTIGSIDLLNIIQMKINNNNIILCPQHLPKFHPNFDIILFGILRNVPNSLIILIDNPKKSQWKYTLLKRWKQSLSLLLNNTNDDKKNMNNYISRIIWLKPLNPKEYVILMSLGDVMIDPYPFGGGVTTLESISMCTPIITNPFKQSVPNLATGMIDKMNLNSSIFNLLVVNSDDQYINNIIKIVENKEYNTIIRKHICDQSHILYNDTESIHQWSMFLKNIRNHHSIK